MTKQLEDFFKSNGINKSITEFNPNQEQQIQSAIDNVIKPALTVLSVELNSYANIKADMMTSKKSTDSVKENIELKVYKTMQAKFSYRPNFSFEGDDIYITGQFCIPNLYGDPIQYKNTDLKKVITDITEDDMKSDFIKAFTANVDIK